MAFKSKTSVKSLKLRVAVAKFRFIKKFKLGGVEQKVINQTYHKLSYRSQKCLVPTIIYLYLLE